jgi:membrane protease YdiL (CAAX protease family)
MVCATPYRDSGPDMPATPWPEGESEAIKKKAPHVWPIFWTYAMAIFVLLITKEVLLVGHQSTGFYLVLSSILFGLITMIASVIHWKSLKVQFRNTGILSWETYVGVGLLGLLLCVNFGYHGFIKHLLRGQDAIDFGLGPLGLILILAVIPGITEEIAFRGLIQHWLQVAIAPWRAIILSAALFSALHLNIISAPYLFVFGVLLGWVKWKTNSLYPSMFLHFLHNLIVISFI